MKKDEIYMKQAINVANNSMNDLPIGAVIVYQKNIIASAHNEVEQGKNILSHAEMLVICKAQKFLNSKNLSQCNLYVTLEPCPMCAWAIIEAKISQVCFGASDLLYGAFGGKIDLRMLAHSKLNVKSGICEQECSLILKEYFRKIRQGKKIQ